MIITTILVMRVLLTWVKNNETCHKTPKKIDDNEEDRYDKQ